VPVIVRSWKFESSPGHHSLYSSISDLVYLSLPYLKLSVHCYSTVGTLLAQLGIIMAAFRKRKDKWHVQIRKSGTAPLTKTFTHKKDAQQWANEIERKIDQGLILELSHPDYETLSQILERYKNEITISKRGGHIEAYRLAKIMRDPVAEIKLSQLSAMHIADYRDRRLQEVSACSVVKEMTLISLSLDIARKEWGVPMRSNVMRDVKKPQPKRGRDRRLSEEEHTLLLRSCSKSSNHWLTPLIIIAIETGMRRGELLSLAWEDVDLDLRVAHLDMTKNGSKRDVPLSSEAINLLRSLPHDISGNVFPLTAAALRGLWNRACRRAGITGLHFHDLRHEATSRFFEKGLNVIEVATITGHKDLRMLQRYTHLRAEDLAKKLG
jgi:integrase